MNNQWFVLSKDVGNVVSQKSYEPTKYDRVRMVNISTDGYMSCSCGYIQRMLMPCRHVCAIINDTKFYTASLFHIRWYKLYNYYYKNNKPTMNGCCNTKDALETLLLSIRSNAYNKSGKYKGIYMYGTPFHNFLQSKSFIPVKDHVNQLMDKIIYETNQVGYVLSNTYSINPNKMVSKSINDEQPSNILVCNNDHFGGNADVSVHLSQDNQAYQQNDGVFVNANDDSFYKKGLHLYEDMMRSCSNEKQFKECVTLMSTQHYKHIAEKGTNTFYGAVGNVQLFGEDRTNKKHIGRHKSIAESLSKKFKNN